MNANPFTRVGFQFASYAFPGTRDDQLFEHVVAIAQTAERSGFDSVWVMDHVQQIDTVGERSDPILEAYTTLAGLAASTSQASLGVLVSACGFRSPALLAKMITTIDIMSKGRAILGLGAGWHEDEYAAYGFAFPPAGVRMRQLAEHLEICRAMFTGKAISFQGRHFRLNEALNVPVPLRPGGPPILVGGGGEQTLIPLLTRRADGCNFFGGVATVRHKLDVLLRACEEVGRDPDTVTKTWLGTAVLANSDRELAAGMQRLGALLGVRPAAVPSLALCGTPDQIADRAGQYRACGIDAVIVNMDDAFDLQRVAAVGEAVSRAMR